MQKNSLVQLIADNFDAQISSRNGLFSTHSLAMLLTSVNTHGKDDPTAQTFRRIIKDEMKDKTCLHDDGFRTGVAPPDVFEVIKCGCATNTPCSTAMCGCYTAILPCTMFFECHGEAHCRNEHTRRVDDSDNYCC